MAQEYEITQFKAGDFTDPHGNVWCDAVFLGVGEPVKMVVKDPSKFSAGMKVYGTITQPVSKAGKPYNRFKREKRPEEQGQSSKPNYQPRDDAAIRAQFAIKTAVALVPELYNRLTEDKQPPEAFIEDWAKTIYAMVDRVKNSLGASITPEVAPNEKPKENVPDWAPQEVRQKLSKEERDEDAEIRSLFEQPPT